MISNTAVPKYYGEFRNKVIMGDIPVNELVADEMHRIDALIANPNIYYDDEAVEGYIRFCENELTLVDGSDLHLLDSFKLWAEQVLSWFYYFDKSVYEVDENGQGRFVIKRVLKRLIKKQFLIVGRGAAKSLYASSMQAYFLIVDPKTTSQFTTAPTMKQAEEVISPIVTAMSRARGPLFKFLTAGSLQNTTGNKANRVKLASTKKGIQNFITNSILEIKPMTIDKVQGTRVKIASIDEWKSGEIREDIIGAAEQGASKLDDYLILAVSSEGTIRNAAGDDIAMELMKILKNEYPNPFVSIWWYRLDDVSEVADPSKWVKANPNLGKTVQYEAYQLDVERAEHSPHTRNDILAKRFGLPVEGHTFFFTYEETFLHTPREYWQLPCAMGADLSRGDDFCSFTFLFPLRDGTFGCKTRSYITSHTLHGLPPAMTEKYTTFIDEGSLIIHEGKVLSMMDVYEDINEYIQSNNYDVRAFGYDPYNAKEFVERWETENSSYGVEKVIQGSKTESVPLGEIKTLMSTRSIIFDQSIMSWSIGNSIAIVDNNGNRKLSKPRHDKKIDNVAALMDAYIAYKANIDEFE